MKRESGEALPDKKMRSGNQAKVGAWARKLVGHAPPVAWGLFLAVTIVYFTGFAMAYQEWRSGYYMEGAEQLNFDLFFHSRTLSQDGGDFRLYGLSIVELFANWIAALGLAALIYWAIVNGVYARILKTLSLARVSIAIGVIGLLSLVIATQFDTAPEDTHNIGLMQVQMLWAQFASVCLLISAILFLGNHLGKKLDRRGDDCQP